MFLCNDTSRNLKKNITAIIKSWNANKIIKINYAQVFSLCEKNIQKSESKILIIDTENEDKLNQFIEGKFPNMERL